MKNFVINLERATERREAMVKEFADHNIAFDFFSGVDWLNLTEDDVRDNVDSKYISKSKNWLDPMSLYGMLACWLSHRSLWQKTMTDGAGGGGE